MSLSLTTMRRRLGAALSCGGLALLCTVGDAPSSKYECTYLTPGDAVPTGVHTYNGSMLVHASLVLPLSVSFHIINTSTIKQPSSANESGLRGTYYVPAIFHEPCSVFNASCDTVTGGPYSYYNTNFSLQEPNQTGVSGGGGRAVRVLGNFLPCGNGSFRLKGILHMQSWGVLYDEFCIGHCC